MSADVHILLGGDAAVRSARLVTADEAALRTRWNQEIEARSFANGRAQGQREALASLAPLLERAVADLDAQREQALARLAQDAATLAVEIARELTRSEIRASRHDIERIVREALAASGVGRGEALVHVHPSDAARLADVPFRANTRIEADPALRAGDVHVTCAQGVLVREIDEALGGLRERLRQELCP